MKTNHAHVSTGSEGAIATIAAVQQEYHGMQHRSFRGTAVILSALCGLLLLLMAVSSALARNKAGHMVSGAIAYAELNQVSPQTLAHVIALLKTQPDFETQWAPRLAQSNLSPEEQDLYLFMLAARWPDDIRQEPVLHRGPWHYINLPYKPAGQPATVHTVEPLPENILYAYQANLDILRSTEADAVKAVALYWIFHLIGDVHQPLHAVALFTTQFPAPKGDGVELGSLSEPAKGPTR